MDVDDAATWEDARFENLGSVAEYGCSRRGVARVLLDDRRIGTISYTLISRGMLGGGVSFLEACDAISQELEQIASKFFKQDGALTKKFLQRLNDKDTMGMANFGCFLYINSVRLEAPFSNSANVHHVKVAATAIEKFMTAQAFRADDVVTTLAM